MRLVRRHVLLWATSSLLVFSLLLASGCPQTGNLGGYVFLPGSARDVHKDGTWLRDSDGRYVLLRGVNLGSRSKLPPYVPVMPLSVTTLDPGQFLSELQAAKPDLARLHALGMNVVRLLIIWKALEPTPNPNLDQLTPEGAHYLDYITKVIDELYYSDGLFVIVDFHQDISNEAYGGDGFPDWALGIDEQHPRPSPPSPSKNWGLNYYDVPFPESVVGGGNGAVVRNTLQSFWNDLLFNQEQTEWERVIDTAQNPRTHLVKTIGQVAKFFAGLNNGAGHPAIIGYEPFNEPHPVGLGKPNFEQNILPKYYGQVEIEIRQNDSKALIFIEPRMDWTTYSADGDEFQGLSFTLQPQSFLPMPYVPSTTSGGIVFAFHYYDPKMAVPLYAKNMHDKVNEWPGVFQLLHDAAVSRGLVPFMTEFGCDNDWTDGTDLRPDIYKNSVVRACMDLQFQQVEAQLLSATYWNYDLYSSAQGKDNWNQENLSLLGPARTPRNFDIVARPYPMRSSATPQRVFFDLGSKNAAFILGGAVVDAPTVIFVPRFTQYPGDDFEVRATTPGTSIVWDEPNQMLYWLPDKARSQNQLIVSPSCGFDSSTLPTDSQTLLPRTTFTMVVGKNKKVPLTNVATVPNLLDRPLTEAQKAVRSIGLSLRVTVSGESQDVDVPTVVRQRPGASMQIVPSCAIEVGVVNPKSGIRP